MRKSTTQLITTLVIVISLVQIASSATLWTGGFGGNWQSNWNVEHGGIEQRSAPGGGTIVEGDKLRVKYAPGHAAASGVWMLAVPVDISSHRTICLSYKIKVPSNFEFNRGGKLPGLYGTTGSTNLNSQCSGGNQPGNCYSARFMWRRDGDGEIYGYMPYPSNTVCNRPENHCDPNYGKSLGRGKWRFPDDNRYHTLKQEIQLNTGSSSNGRARVWLDGVLKTDQSNLKWRRNDNIKHKGIFFNTFFGGGTSWAPSSTQYLYFGDFEISTSCSAGPSNQVCLRQTVTRISGSSFTVKVDYTTATNQDLRVSLFTTGGSYRSHKEVRVNQGSGSKTVTVPTNGHSGTGFRIKVSLEPIGKDWRSETAAKYFNMGQTGCS